MWWWWWWPVVRCAKDGGWLICGIRSFTAVFSPTHINRGKNVITMSRNNIFHKSFLRHKRSHYVVIIATITEFKYPDSGVARAGRLGVFRSYFASRTSYLFLHNFWNPILHGGHASYIVFDTRARDCLFLCKYKLISYNVQTVCVPL